MERRGVRVGVAPEASLCWFTCTGLAQTINKTMTPSGTLTHFFLCRVDLRIGSAVQSVPVQRF